MKILNRAILIKHQRKNRGNFILYKEIDDLITILRDNDFNLINELKLYRPDADLVNEKGFYFFNISTHRILAYVDFELMEVYFTWIGTHDEYERIFKNNKKVIEKWLIQKGWI